MKEKAFIKKTVESFLLKHFFFQWRRGGEHPSYEKHLVPGICQSGTDALHALVIIEIVGNSKYDTFQMPGITKLIYFFFLYFNSTCVIPWVIISILFAAFSLRSMILPFTNGPRSLIRTLTFR